jgi:hypothetical protein
MNALQPWELRDLLPSKARQESYQDALSNYRLRQPYSHSLRPEFSHDAWRYDWHGCECLDAPDIVCAGSTVSMGEDEINPSFAASSIALIPR